MYECDCECASCMMAAGRGGEPSRQDADACGCGWTCMKVLGVLRVF